MSLLSQLQSDPMGFLINFLYRAPAVLIALTLHELAHGYTALRCGDPTAEMMGRLSFNPLKHLDPIGAVCMLLFGVGWARPVPVNPRNFRHFRRDELMVSAAGIVTNLLLFLVGTLFMALGVRLMLPVGELGKDVGSFMLRFDSAGFYDLMTGGALYDGQLLTMLGAQYTWIAYILRFLCNFTMINLSLALFNLIPFPPLDGYRLADALVLRGRLHLSGRAMQICMVAFLALNYFTDFVSQGLYRVMIAVQSGVLWAILPLFGMA